MFEAFDAALIDSLNALVEEQNYTKAAKRLSITQPALTQRIKKLERLLGQRVVCTGSSGLTLTKTGELFLSEGRQIFATLAEGIARLQKRTTLSFAAEHEIMSLVLDRGISFLEQRWQLPLKLITAIPKDAVGAVAAGECDFAIVDCDEIPENLCRIEVGTVSYHLVLPDYHPLLNRTKLLLNDLESQDFVAFSPYTQHRTWFDQLIEASKLSVNLRFDGVLSELLFAAVRDGWGLAFMPDFLPVPTGCRSSYIGNLPKRKYYVLTQKSRMNDTFKSLAKVISHSFHDQNQK